MTEDFSTPDTFGIRIGGLPVPMLDDMRSPELWDQVETVLAGERRLAATADELSDALFELIGRGPAGKPELVALRRSIHNGRPLAARCWNDGIRALLPAHVADGVRAWLELVAAHRHDVAHLDELVGHHTRNQHILLRKAVADPAFQHGLILSSPVCYGQLRKWLARPDDTAPDRGLALRLTKYLARITTKTSPFSTFTISGIGHWHGRNTAAPATGPAVRSVVEINVWVVQQLLRQLSGHPALAGRLRLRLNPSALLAGDRWEFLGPGSDEPLRSLAATAPVQACVDAVTGAGRVREDAVDETAARTGSTPAAADAYLGRLVELGLLEAERPFADQALDPLGELRTWVASAGPPLEELSSALAELAGHLADYPVLARPSDRLRRSREIDAELLRIRTLAGPDRIDLPAKNSIIENALLTAPADGPDRQRWTPVLRDLDAVRRCYAVLDPALPGRVALTEAFAERIGPGATVPFLVFHRAVQQWLREDPDLPGVLSIATHGYQALAHHRLPRIRELSRIRAELCATVLEGQADERGVLRLDPQQLSAAAGQWPAWMRPPDSVAFYGQPVGGAGEPQFVINAVNSGHGRGRDRVRRLLAQAGTAAEVATAPPPADEILADTCRHYGSNVGLRTSALACEIDYPGGLSRRSAAERIPVGDLVVRHDPDLELLTLRSRSRDAVVRPVHPNLIAELWLPPAIRLLMQAFGATANLLIPGRRMFGDTSLDRVDGVLAQPRVVIGRTTVSRRQWVFPVSAVPSRQKGESDRARLVRLAAWLHTHGMPQRCFVRGLDPDSVVGGSVWRIKSRKPLYVDFASLLLVGVFERMLTDPRHLLFLQEALPGPADAPSYGDNGSRVTEYLVEINGGRDADR
ncbi:lantibiotic dehydratase [Streptomyces sp. NBC_01014]|uniref:lantibiotic dehydratase n=1 Tax=Streptomyces sp. NBC_01014 TaxID=2903719 RepID=UPI0038639382|nr:lantibiotic dehydratase family protein [Streptomyces sp. NBC_01014]